MTDPMTPDPWSLPADDDWLGDRLEFIPPGEFKSLTAALEGKAATPDGAAGAARLRAYWTTGEGAAKIRARGGGKWTFDGCVAETRKHLEGREKGYCALLFKSVHGYYPGDKRNRKDASTWLDDEPITLAEFKHQVSDD